MTKQELQEELEARQWRPKQVYTKTEKNTLAQIARTKSQAKKIQQKAQVKAHLESSKNAPRNQKGSISFKKSNPIQICHNDRTEPPSYLLESGGMGVECNRDNGEAQILKQKLIDEASRAYTAHTGQRLQAKSYEWSAVCNIKPTTTMQDLESLAEHFQKKYGFQCYQIAIHRDEGHIDESGQEQINHHAHLEFITLDKESGRNRQRDLKKNNLRQIQTEVAEILQMERGIDKRISKRERIEPRYFAKIADEIKQETKIQKEREALHKPQIKLTSDKNEIIYLNVPHNEKDEAKTLGAKWDSSKKQWYIPQVDCASFAKWWLPDFKTKSQEISELHEKMAEKDEVLDSMRGKLNTAQASLENAKKEIVSLKEIKAEFEVLRKIMIKWKFCDKEDYKIRTELLEEALENAKEKKYTQADLDNDIAKARQTIQERHKQEIEALESENQALKAKISDFNQKQGVSIAQDEFSDLKAQNEAEFDFKSLDYFILGQELDKNFSNQLESCKKGIEDNKRYAENERNAQVRCAYVNEVIQNNVDMDILMNKYAFFGRYFSFQPYRELYQKTKEWIEQKAKQWDLSRDKGLSR